MKRRRLSMLIAASSRVWEEDDEALSLVREEEKGTELGLTERKRMVLVLVLLRLGSEGSQREEH